MRKRQDKPNPALAIRPEWDRTDALEYQLCLAKSEGSNQLPSIRVVGPGMAALAAGAVHHVLMHVRPPVKSISHCDILHYRKGGLSWYRPTPPNYSNIQDNMGTKFTVM